MAEAPDAQFVAEDAVYIYHKKFMVCDNTDEGSIDDDEVYHLWRQNHPKAKCDVFQENWFHDCDNEHAKITAFFQVMNVQGKYEEKNYNFYDNVNTE